MKRMEEEKRKRIKMSTSQEHNLVFILYEQQWRLLDYSLVNFRR